LTIRIRPPLPMQAPLVDARRDHGDRAAAGKQKNVHPVMSGAQTFSVVTNWPQPTGLQYATIKPRRRQSRTCGCAGATAGVAVNHWPSKAEHLARARGHLQALVYPAPAPGWKQ
jgi:hypothetical protein